MLKSNLEYTPLEFFAAEGPDGIPESFDSQEYLIKKAREDYLHSLEVREEQAAHRSATARVQRIRDREMMTSAATPVVENPETGEPLPGVGNVAPQAEDANAVLETTESQEATLGADAAQAAAASAAGSAVSMTGSEAGSGSDATDLGFGTAGASISSVTTSTDAPASASASTTSTAASASAGTSTEGTSVAGGIEEVEPGVAGPVFGTAGTQATTQQAATATQQPTSAQVTDTAATAQTQESAQVAPEVEVIPTEQKASEAGAIQLVPKKPSLWTRIKFLFTGKLS